MCVSLENKALFSVCPGLMVFNGSIILMDLVTLLCCTALRYKLLLIKDTDEAFTQLVFSYWENHMADDVLSKKIK